MLKQLTINHSEKQTGFVVVNGIVVDVSTVYHAADTPAVKNRLVVAGNDFGYRHVVTAFHHPLGNARGIDGRVALIVELVSSNGIVLLKTSGNKRKKCDFLKLV